MPAILAALASLRINATAIIGGIMGIALLAAFVGLTLTRHTLATRTDQLHAVQASLKTEEQAHAISNASLATCEATNRDNVAQLDALGKRYSDAQAQAVKDGAALDAAQKADRSRMETLRSLAGAQAPGSGCRASAALLDAVKGL